MDSSLLSQVDETLMRMTSMKNEISMLEHRLRAAESIIQDRDSLIASFQDEATHYETIIAGLREEIARTRNDLTERDYIVAAQDVEATDYEKRLQAVESALSDSNAFNRTLRKASVEYQRRIQDRDQRIQDRDNTIDALRATIRMLETQLKEAHEVNYELSV